MPPRMLDRGPLRDVFEVRFPDRRNARGLFGQVDERRANYFLGRSFKMGGEKREANKEGNSSPDESILHSVAEIGRGRSKRGSKKKGGFV